MSSNDSNAGAEPMPRVYNSCRPSIWTHGMRNPWIKKNAFLSMWLSGANALFGSLRGHASAEANGQLRAMTRTATKQMVDFWTGGAVSGSRKRKKRTRR